MIIQPVGNAEKDIVLIVVIIFLALIDKVYQKFLDLVVQTHMNVLVLFQERHILKDRRENKKYI